MEFDSNQELRRKAILALSSERLGDITLLQRHLLLSLLLTMDLQDLYEEEEEVPRRVVGNPEAQMPEVLSPPVIDGKSIYDMPYRELQQFIVANRPPEMSQDFSTSGKTLKELQKLAYALKQVLDETKDKPTTGVSSGLPDFDSWMAKDLSTWIMKNRNGDMHYKANGTREDRVRTAKKLWTLIASNEIPSGSKFDGSRTDLLASMKSHPEYYEASHFDELDKLPSEQLKALERTRTH